MVVQELSNKDLWRFAYGPGGELEYAGWGTTKADIVNPSLLSITAYEELHRLLVKLGSNTLGRLQWGCELAGPTAINVVQPIMQFDRDIELTGWNIFRRNRRIRRFVSTLGEADPVQITTSQPHGMLVSGLVTIIGNTGTPSLNGTYTATVVDADTFTIPFDNDPAVATANGTVLIGDVQPWFLSLLGDDGTNDGVAIAQGRFIRSFTGKTFFDVHVMRADDTREFSCGQAPSADETTAFAPLLLMQKGERAILTGMHASPGASTEAHIELAQMQESSPTLTIASAADPTVLTFDAAHGHSSGTFIIHIRDNTGTPSLNGTHLATYVSATTCSIPVDNGGDTVVLDGEILIEDASVARRSLVAATGGKAFTGKVDCQIWADKGPAILVAKNVKSDAGAAVVYCYAEGKFVDALDASKFYFFKEEKAADDEPLLATVAQNVAANGPVLVEQVALCGNPTVSCEFGFASDAAGTGFSACAHLAAADPDKPENTGSWLDENGVLFMLLRHDDTGGTAGKAAMVAISGHYINQK